MSQWGNDFKHIYTCIFRSKIISASYLLLPLSTQGDLSVTLENKWCRNILLITDMSPYDLWQSNLWTVSYNVYFTGLIFMHRGSWCKSGCTFIRNNTLNWKCRLFPITSICTVLVIQHFMWSTMWGLSGPSSPFHLSVHKMCQLGSMPC